jgi:hypothetical protein
VAESLYLILLLVDVSIADESAWNSYNFCLVWMSVLKSGVGIISLLLSYDMPLF